MVRAALPRRTARLASLALAMAAASIGGTGQTQNAVANGDTRTLSLVHLHTKESATITFKRDGRYDRAALDQLNWLLRDWRENESVKMDPRLFDVVWEAQRSLGSTQPLQIVCGYRSPGTNGMLRRRSRGVAEHSQHTQGKAMDFFIPDASVDDLRAAGMRLQRGGVGWYPRSGSPFVHLDVGSVRSWPRMSQDQLARLFPDGKTVHLPANGKPLARYDVAKAEILSRGGTVEGLTTVAQSDPYDDGIKGFFAGLFGGGATSGKSQPPVAVASADQALAYAASTGTDVLRQAMLRREEGETSSARALLTGMAVRPSDGSAPLPPRRPAEFAAVEAAIAMPLPPERPIQLASLDGGIPGMANTSDGAPAASVAHLVPADAGSEAQLRALFRNAAQGASEPASRSAPIRLAQAQVKPGAGGADGLLTNGPGVTAGYFSWRSPGDELAASRFSGSLADAFQATQ